MNRLIRIISFFLLLVIFSQSLFADCDWVEVEKLRDAGYSENEIRELCGNIPQAPTELESIEINNACSYYNDVTNTTVRTFSSEDEARNYISRIVSDIGLEQNFDIRAGAVPNALADVIGTRRVIIYNPRFIGQMEQASGSKWAGVSILAHEVGHHLNAHFLTPGGSRPATELEADKFSGAAMQRLGANKNEAIAAMRVGGSNVASTSHPARNDRIQAIIQGWESSCSNDANCNSGSQPAVIQSPIPAPPPQIPQQPQVVYASVCSTNVGVCPMAEALPIGSQCFCYTTFEAIPGIAQ